MEQREDGGGRRAPVVGVILKQEEVDFIKALSSIELSPVYRRELRKAMAAGKKKALAASKVDSANASALERPSRVVGEARTYRDSLQLNVRKRKAEELSSSDCPAEPASRRRPPSGHLFDDGPEASHC